MHLTGNPKAFSLVEIIIVVIIVGVMLSIALPRFFQTIAYSWSVEAMESIKKLNHAVGRCYVMAGGRYDICRDINALDVENPENVPGNHFTYTLTTNTAGDYYMIVATRNSLDGGTPGDVIILERNSEGVSRRGTGVFRPIK